jgi:hypothetical protein
VTTLSVNHSQGDLVAQNHAILGLLMHNTNRLGHFCPTLVLLSLKPAKINSSYGQTAVVQKSAYIFYRFSGIPTEFSGCMAEDVDSGWGDSSLSEILL